MKLSKEKQQQLILVALVTVGVLGALWYLVIRAQYGSIAANAKKVGDLQTKISDAEGLLKHATEYESELQAAQQKLSEKEAKMLPVGNEYIPLLNTLNQAVKTTKVEFLGDLNQPVFNAAEDMFTTFPYKSAVFSDTIFYGNYHEFGKFLAEMENDYPYMRFNLSSIGPLTVPRPDDPEKLQFKVKIIALLQPPAQK